MSPLHVLILCSVAWFALVQKTDVPAVAVGVVVVASAWALFHRALTPGEPLHTRRLRAAFLDIPRFYVLYALPNLLTTTRWFVWPPGGPSALEPCIIAVQLSGASETALSVFAHGLTLSANEHVIAIDRHRKEVFVHLMHARDPDARRRALKDVYDRYLREVS